MKTWLKIFALVCAVDAVAFYHAWADEQRTNRVIENPVSDGDMIFKVNDGGVKTDAMKIVGSVGKVELSTRTDGTCGVGNVCSGTFTSTASSPANLDATPTCEAGRYIRIGNVVSYGFRCSVNPTSAGTSTSFQITLPQISANFVADGDASGSCANNPSVSTRSTEAWTIEPNATTQRVYVSNSNTQETGARPINCTVIFKAQ